MIHRAGASLLTLLVVLCGSSALPIPADLIALNSSKGFSLLRSASHSESFWQLSMHLDAQINLGFCGPATVCAVLNALSSAGLTAPVSAIYSVNGSFHGHHVEESFNYFVQSELFNQSCVKRLVDTRGYDASVHQLAAIFQCFAAASVTPASNSTVAAFRKAVVGAFGSKPAQHVTVNFDRGGLNQVPKGGGHHSPLGAYDAETDRVLLMDVARYKYPFVWVPLPMMFEAMRNVTSTGESRGYIVVSHPEL